MTDSQTFEKKVRQVVGPRMTRMTTRVWESSGNVMGHELSVTLDDGIEVLVSGETEEELLKTMRRSLEIYDGR